MSDASGKVDHVAEALSEVSIRIAKPSRFSFPARISLVAAA